MVTQEKEALISISNTDLSYMQGKRRKDQILAQILILCREGASKTMIVYQVNLNFRTVKTYLGLLLKKDLLEVIPGYLIIYKTTA